ncbi:Tyrosine-protein kinase ptk [Rubripirellula lacrimiformis]|uniref:Tyrosine-protein kinase ptk n=1 Tax=Rubripirellula lacrimiformis TaxID=1930273 RepID=A0A517NGN1_9BACT|nr:tyrosine-protein kinase family protein [Rubripirellula lacrimiformis]QDT06296.1 Tyrosine-protein kinase ptk [Rubripirellula lacrimiformis]
MHPSRSASSASIGDAASGASFDPWMLWVTVRRCWFWAVPIGLVLASLAGFVVLKTFVPRYKAIHLLEANQDYVVFKGVMPMVDDLVRTERALFLNPIVLDPVLSDPDLRSAPSLSDPETAEAQLRKNLSVQSAGAKTQMLVSYEDSDRDMAAKVCNAVVNAYLRQRDAFDSKRTNNLERWLEPEIQRWEAEVSNRQSRVQSLSERTLGFNPAARLSVAEDESSLALFAELRSKITDIEVKLSVLDASEAMANEVEIENVSDLAAADSVSVMDLDAAGVAFVPVRREVRRQSISSNDVDRMAQTDADVLQARKKAAYYEGLRLNMEASDLVRINREHYRGIVADQALWEGKVEEALTAARERVQAELEDRAETIYKQELAAVDAEVQLQRDQFLADQQLAKRKAVAMRQAAMKIDQETAQLARKELEARLAVLNTHYDRERVRLEQLGGDAAELQFAEEDLAVGNGVLDKLRQRVAEIRTERRQDGAVRSLAEATPPRAPVESIPTKKILMASGACFAIPFLVGLLWEMRTQRITDANAVDRCAVLAPVVGELTRAPIDPRNSKGRRIFEESVDALRANLFLSQQTRGARTIAICSSMSGEGKSTAAAQLAVSLAKASNKTVLLVDGDTRCPDLHDVFGIDLSPGLTGVLGGRVELKDAINRSLGNLVHVLPAGRLDASPHRLITQSGIETLIEQALQQYDFIVFDTAPVLSAGETLALAAATDVTLLCVMRDRTRMDSLERTSRRLESAGANVTGTIFSGVTSRAYAYRYGDYHYSAIES